jgi:hypothetical protein
MHRKLKLLVLIFFIIAMSLHKTINIFVVIILIVICTQVAHAQTVPSQPHIQTYSTATSSTVIITSPSGYKSEVISTYNGNQFQTFATSTPLTDQDIASMQYNILSEEQALQQMFQEQENLFNTQENMFQSMWSTAGI